MQVRILPGILDLRQIALSGVPRDGSGGVGVRGPHRSPLLFQCDRAQRGGKGRWKSSRGLLCLKQPMSKAVSATSRGPTCPWGTPGGSSPQVATEQHEQASRCSWYSLTSGLISGMSQTWCRSCSGSDPARRSPHHRQLSGLTAIDRLAVFDGNQRPFVFRMPGLTARLFAAGFFPRGGLGVRMFGARRNGRIARRLLQRRDLGFQRGNSQDLLGDPRQQQTNDGLRLRCLLGDRLLPDQRFLRHAVMSIESGCCP